MIICIMPQCRPPLRVSHADTIVHINTDTMQCRLGGLDKQTAASKSFQASFFGIYANHLIEIKCLKVSQLSMLDSDDCKSFRKHHCKEGRRCCLPFCGILITKHLTSRDISGISAATVNTNTPQISNTDYTLELPTSIVESAI